MGAGSNYSLASNYPGGFANGISIRGIPLVQTNPGRVFWVDNSAQGSGDVFPNGSDGNVGNYNAPFATLNYAMTQARANKGDIIFVKPGHAETITATNTVFGTAGVAIIGLGIGSSRPTLTFSTTTATITVTAPNITVQNVLHLGNAATTFVASAYTSTNAVVATDVTLDNCEFRDVSATLGFVNIFTCGTTANQNDGLQFTNNLVRRNLTSPPAANTAVIGAAALDRGVFSSNNITNSTANNNIALLLAMGANAFTNVVISGNRTASLNTGTTAGELFSSSSTACSGLVSDNYSGHLAATGLLGPTGTKLKFIQNFCHITGAADKSALINPAAV